MSTPKGLARVWLSTGPYPRLSLLMKGVRFVHFLPLPIGDVDLA